MDGNVSCTYYRGRFFPVHHNLWMAWDKSWMVLRELLSVAVSISCLSAFFCKVREEREQKMLTCIFKQRVMDDWLTLANAVVMALNLETIWLLRQVFPGSRICRYSRTSLAYCSCVSRISTGNINTDYLSAFLSDGSWQELNTALYT